MTERSGTPLTSIDGFPAQYAQQLAELKWIITAEDLVGTALREEGAEGLSKDLNMPIDMMNELIDMAHSVLPAAMTFSSEPEIEFGEGALVDPEEGEDADWDNLAGAVSAASLPQKIDFKDRFPPVRNQNPRPTCVAFACTAVREYLLGKNSTQGDFSEQYLYWNCKERDGIPTEPGTYVRVGMEALEEDGICVEDIWQYVNDHKATQGQGPPPSGAGSDAKKHRFAGKNRLPKRGVQTIKEALAQKKAVAFAVDTYRYWKTNPTVSTGDVRMPLSNEIVSGGHAMCMVGYEDDPAVPGGGFFLVRNSWGEHSWGRDSSYAAGYARIPYAYIEKCGRSAYTAYLDKEPAGVCAWFKGLIRRLFGSD